MLTLFSIPKPFRGEIATIQRNAIQSWTLLRPECEIILFGDDEGVAEAAAEFGVRHVPHVARNEYGTPLLNSVFETAERVTMHPILCYVNADIILLSDFPRAVERVADELPFLMVGQRWDIVLQGSWDFSQKDWEGKLRDYIAAHGRLHTIVALDYFVFPRDLWKHLPPFAIGRSAWDNWLVYAARALGALVVDATPVVFAIHQNHDYRHIRSRNADVWKGPEARRNRELVGGEAHLYTLLDATHILSPSGRKQAVNRHHSKRQVDPKSLEEHRRVLSQVFREGLQSPKTYAVCNHAIAATYWYQGHLERKSRKPQAALQSIRRAHELAPATYPWNLGWVFQFWLHTYFRFPFWMLPLWAIRRAQHALKRLLMRPHKPAIEH